MAYPERIVPDETGPGIVAIHLKRYDFARQFCAGAEVLDGACGVGYGTAYLAETAGHVVGVDVSTEAIEYARRRYAAPNVEFRVADLLELDLPDRRFGAVCSFETIEHLTDPERWIAHAARVLRDDGVFVASTPNARETTHRPDNPHHEVELSRADFEALLRRSFGEVELFGQRRLQTGRHRAMQRLDVLGLRKRLGFLRRASVLLGTPPMADATSEDLAIDREDLERATELVAVCRRPFRAG